MSGRLNARGGGGYGRHGQTDRPTPACGLSPDHRLHHGTVFIPSHLPSTNHNHTYTTTVSVTASVTTVNPSPAS
jgi:hypothetical protein